MTMKRDDRKPERITFLVMAAAYGAILAKGLLGPLIQ
jgi:hypothetical protein